MFTPKRQLFGFKYHTKSSIGFSRFSPFSLQFLLIKGLKESKIPFVLEWHKWLVFQHPIMRENP